MAILFLVTALLAQSDADYPFVIVLKSGERVHAWVDEERLDDTIVPVELDEPWLPASERNQNLRGFDIDLDSTYRELSVSRERRIAEGWRAHGGVQVETRDGTTWVEGEEADWAAKARALAEANRKTHRETVTRVLPSSSSPAQSPEPGFSELWGGHVAVLTIGIGLAALTAWFLIFQ